MEVCQDEVATSVITFEVLGVGSHVGQGGGEEDVEVLSVKEWGFGDVLVFSWSGIGIRVFEGSMGVSVRRRWRRTVARRSSMRPRVSSSAAATRMGSAIASASASVFTSISRRGVARRCGVGISSLVHWGRILWRRWVASGWR